MQSVIETSRFTKSAKATGVTVEELADMIALLAANPLAGDVMEGTGGARKVRIARHGISGKSGGYRIITYFGGHDVPLFLLDVFGKGEKANLSKADRNALAAVLPKLGAAYRASTKAAAAELMKMKGRST